jgi:hypothetical protein
VTGSLMPGLLKKLASAPAGWIVLSRKIRRAQNGEPLTLNTNNIKALLTGAEFPRPLAQADELILLLVDRI